jgi:hypothetical protein
VPEAALASSHFEPDGYGDARKFLINYYVEPNGGDPQRQTRLVNTPGSRIIDDSGVLTTGVRGLFQADGFAGGKIVVPDGTTIRLYDASAATWSALTGTMAGTDRVRAVFGEVQAGFLSGGNLFQSDGASVAALSDADWATLLSDASETAYTSIATMGQRLLASYGSRFAFSTTLEFNTTTTLSYYTAEYAPDGIVGLAVIANTLMVFGTQSIQPWVETGNNDDPFSPIVGQEIDRGAACRDSIVKLDNTLFFVGDDYSVYRLNGLTPQIINANDPWVSRILQATDPDDIVCSAIETEAHKFYVVRTPTRCMVYDIATGTWHLRQTYGSDTWEWVFHVSVDGKQYAAPEGATLVELSRSYASDRQADASTFGTEIVGYFSAHVPVNRLRPALGQIRLEGAKGVGLSSGQGSNPLISLAISRDKGNTFGAYRDRTIGAIGAYNARTSWEQNGRAQPEQTVLLFRISDPVRRLWSRVAIGER